MVTKYHKDCLLSRTSFCDTILSSGWDGFFWRRNGRRRGTGYLETVYAALGCGIGDVTADDLIFVDQQRCIHRITGTGVIVDFVDIAHHIFTGVGCQIVALGLLQLVVAVINF